MSRTAVVLLQLSAALAFAAVFIYMGFAAGTGTADSVSALIVMLLAAIPIGGFFLGLAAILQELVRIRRQLGAPDHLGPVANRWNQTVEQYADRHDPLSPQRSRQGEERWTESGWAPVDSERKE